MDEKYVYFIDKSTSIDDYSHLACFDEHALISIFEFSADKLQRMMALEIARLKGLPMGRDPQPDDKELA